MTESIFIPFNELHLGDRQQTRGRTITEADVVNFAGVTGDYYGLHTDAEFAGQTRYGERIAHGLLVLSFTLGLLDLRSPAIVAFYGMDQLRFVRPVKIGDTIRATVEVIKLDERDAATGLLTAQLQVTNQRQEIVLTGLIKMLLQKQL